MQWKGTLDRVGNAAKAARLTFSKISCCACLLCMQGEWVAAPVIPGALLVNLGDMAAMW